MATCEYEEPLRKPICTRRKNAAKKKVKPKKKVQRKRITQPSNIKIQTQVLNVPQNICAQIQIESQQQQQPKIQTSSFPMRKSPTNTSKICVQQQEEQQQKLLLINVSNGIAAVSNSLAESVAQTVLMQFVAPSIEILTPVKPTVSTEKQVTTTTIPHSAASTTTSTFTSNSISTNEEQILPEEIVLIEELVSPDDRVPLEDLIILEEPLASQETQQNEILYSFHEERMIDEPQQNQAIENQESNAESLSAKHANDNEQQTEFTIEQQSNKCGVTNYTRAERSRQLQLLGFTELIQPTNCHSPETGLCHICGALSDTYIVR